MKILILLACAVYMITHQGGHMEREYLGLRTTIYRVSNIEEGKEWYRRVLGYDPYFDQPFYVGFSVGGYELGLLPDESTITRGNSPVAYWGVDDARASLDRLLTLGAVADESLKDVGDGILVATVKDPWGNTVGIIQNPHFKAE